MPFHGCIRRLELKQAENIIVNVDLGYEQFTRAKNGFSIVGVCKRSQKTEFPLAAVKFLV